MNKPRIKWDSKKNFYLCFGVGTRIGVGKTPERAFDSYLSLITPNVELFNLAA